MLLLVFKKLEKAFLGSHEVKGFSGKCVLSAFGDANACNRPAYAYLRKLLTKQTQHNVSVCEKYFFSIKHSQSNKGQYFLNLPLSLHAN